MSASRRWVALVALAATLTLSACSAAAPTPTPKPTAHVSTQSIAAACNILGQPVSAAAGAMSSISTDLTKDPAKANAELQAFADAFDTGLKGVQNAKVHAAGLKTETSLKLMVTELTAVRAKPSSAEAAKLIADATTFEQDFDAVATLCS